MDSEYVIESHDISGVGKAPNVAFVYSGDGLTATAHPPRACISVVVVSEETGRVEIKCGDFTTRVTVQCEEHDPIHGPWAELMETACAIYWSMWRRQELYAIHAKKAGE